MYELIKVSENCYYIDCPSKIGIVKLSEEKVCLIDSGNSRDTGKKIKKILDFNGWKLDAIYNTHSNSDHIGGNSYLQSQTGCKVYAPKIECALTRHTILEPAFLFGGFPPKELRHKFLLAEESDAEYLTADSLPKCIEAIELEGHFFNMVGFKTSDGIMYLADALSSKATLDKYGIGVIYDVGAYLKTLEAIKNINAKLFIPSHAEPTDNISPLAQYNIDKVNEVSDKILKITSDGATFEGILTKLFDAYSLTLSIEQYALVGSTVRSYLAYLRDNEKIEIVIKNSTLFWHAL